MKPKKNRVASFFYRVSENCIVPLRFLLNDIIGRLLTVLKPGEFGNAKSIVVEILIRIGLALLVLPIIGFVVAFCNIYFLVNYVFSRNNQDLKKRCCVYEKISRKFCLGCGWRCLSN